MDTIGKTFGAGIVFFAIVVAGLVGSKADQTTIALLGGTFIGLLVAIPTTLLVVLIARRRNDTQGAAPPAPAPTPTPTPSKPTVSGPTVRHVHHVYIHVRPGSTMDENINTIRVIYPDVTYHEARAMIRTGAVKLLEDGRAQPRSGQPQHRQSQ